MFNKLFTLFISAFMVLIISSLSFGQAVIFEDNFDSYTAGVGAACQNGTDWTTWSNAPCTGEDPLVSSTYSASSPNSVNIIANNDFVHVFPNYTSGQWRMDFKLYIASGNTAYFNTLSAFAGGSSQWAMQVYFNNGGLGDMDAGAASAHQFTYSYDTWMDVSVVADLDSDVGEFWLNGTMEYTWQWSLGTFGTGILQLGGNNFYGGGTDGIPDYYVDDYSFTDLLAAPTGFTDDFDSYTAGQQLACQNPTDWTTWSLAPCDATEDPYVSNAYSYSGSNSVVIVQNNDLIHTYGSLTSGKWYISFLVYIPTGATGYFNTMSGFTPNSFEWAMECNFDAGGSGSLDAPGGPYAFTWVEDSWQQVIVVVDLDTDNAEFWFGSSAPLTQIATWQWTLGGSLRLDANDFFGAAGTDEMYMDNFYFGDTPPVIVPVELTSFAASVNHSGNVILNWTTATELNNQMFEIERRSNEGQYITLGYVDGHGTTTQTQQYSYTDNTAKVGTYFYRLKQIDFNGRYTYSDAIEVDVNGPLTFTLGQNYPNPFNPTTSFDYNVPETGVVKLAIYNSLGEEVAVLVDGMVEAGFYNVTFDASSLPSGAYFYRLQSGNSVQVKKMLLMK